MISVTTSPRPTMTRDSRPFWEACRQRELRIQRCRDCGTFRFPPLPSCVECASLATDWVKVSGKGTIYSFTVVRHAVHSAFSVPYVLAIVALPDAGDVRLTTRIVEWDEARLRVGAAVEVAFEKLDEEITLPLFGLA